VSTIQEVLRRELTFLARCDSEEELAAACDAYKEWQIIGSVLVSEAKRRKRTLAINRLTARLNVLTGR